MANPLDQFVSSTPNKFDLRITPIPKLSDHIGGAGGYKDLMAGIGSHGQAMEIWRQNLELALSKVMANVNQKVSDVATSTSTAKPTANVTTVVAQASAPIDPTIVHLQDEQSIDRKTIGEQFPRPAKVSRLIASNTIDDGEAVFVSAGFNMCMAGTLAVKGSIQIEGWLVVLGAATLSGAPYFGVHHTLTGAPPASLGSAGDTATGPDGSYIKYPDGWYTT